MSFEGNRFGAGGIEDIQAAVRELGFADDVLDSLSDDEEDASDDNGDEDVGYKSEGDDGISDGISGNEGDSAREDDENDENNENDVDKNDDDENDENDDDIEGEEFAGSELQVKGVAIKTPLLNDTTPQV